MNAFATRRYVRIMTCSDLKTDLMPTRISPNFSLGKQSTFVLLGLGLDLGVVVYMLLIGEKFSFGCTKRFRMNSGAAAGRPLYKAKR